ncbi:diguanylate cyclase domain-containing protein [Mariprofundus ferrooxydans]|uniref:GGDEF domain-containing protein n=1 Tax=Mariprofundus ferrooxydans TaxID=314344 RepID=UPI0003611F51|nr:GGDEF domain-containing protein [Mariprofundus ferrooxydans]
MFDVSNAQIRTAETERDEVLAAAALQYAEPVNGGAMATAVLERFRRDENLMALPVVDAEMRPLGLVTRRKILSVFGHKFSHELYRRKQVDFLMEESAIVLDIRVGIEKISHTMTDREAYCAFDPAIITSDGVYSGMLSVISVLRSITQSRIEQAFDCNPLTHLPGNNSINMEIDRRLQGGGLFVLAYIDLDFFKVFNDHYGYERGDRVIQLVAQLLRDCTGPDDFTGHVGGDDFVILFESEQWRSRAERLLDHFQRESALLYDASDREQGYLVGENRQGERMCFQLMSLSVAAVPCDPGVFQSHIELAEVASEVKHKAKLVPGNSIVVNQRHY